MSVLSGIGIYLGVTFILALLQGCSTPEPGTPEAMALKVEQNIEQKEETIENTLDITPEWFFKVPISDNAIYTAGTSTSPDLQLAVDKGLLHAKRALADRLNSLVSSKTKLFVKETGQYENTATVTEGEQATINLIAEVNVAGYTAKEILTLQQDTYYRTFVLLEYPIGKLNKVQLETLRKQQKRESAASAKQAFEELEKELQ
mgnify:CR=1 FL=1